MWARLKLHASGLCSLCEWVCALLAHRARRKLIHTHIVRVLTMCVLICLGTLHKLVCVSKCHFLQVGEVMTTISAHGSYCWQRCRQPSLLYRLQGSPQALSSRQSISLAPINQCRYTLLSERVSFSNTIIIIRCAILLIYYLYLFRASTSDL